jgi:peptidoglycan/LPS O-acetylase OafA/YrhL
VQALNSVREKPKYDYSLENLRGMSILFVVLSHISSFDSLGSVSKYIEFFFRDATTWFVFIAGYLFFYIEQRKFTYRGYLAKKAKFVLLPYLLLSVPAIAFGLVHNWHHLLNLSPQAYVLWSLTVGGWAIPPLWFIPMITLFYILSPLFLWLGNNWVKYAVVLLGIIIGLFTSRPVGNLNPLLSFSHFFGFYALGIASSASREYVENLKHSRASVWLIGLGATTFIVAAFIYGMRDNAAELGYYAGLGELDIVQLGKLGLLIAVFFGFGRFMNVRNRFMSKLAEISFGLFFIQGFCMLVFRKVMQTVTFDSAWIQLATEVGIVFGGSVLIVLLVRHFLGQWSRYVIGC